MMDNGNYYLVFRVAEEFSATQILPVGTGLFPSAHPCEIDLQEFQPCHRCAWAGLVSKHDTYIIPLK